MRAVELLGDENKPAPGDLRFVQAFVNTLDVDSGRDAFAEPAGLERWLKTHGILRGDIRLGERDRLRAIAFREALRTVLSEGEEGDEAAIAVIEDVGGQGRLSLKTTDHGHLALVPVGDDLSAALAELLAVVHTAMLAGTWERLKVCAADTCRWAFYDASKNRSGAWCSMEVCGNRAKVREHRARSRGT